MIGIDENTWLVYEGATTYGHGIWPSPVISKATLIEKEEDWKALPTSAYIYDAKCVFREDSYDPVTRVRRGRLYFWDGQSQPREWYVSQHPAIFNDVGAADTQGRFRKTLSTFVPIHDLASKLKKNSRLSLALGVADAMTLWRIVSIEKIAAGEDLVTLRGRSSLGTLPNLIDELIPVNGRQQVAAAIDRVTDAAYRESPTSLVDQCRNAAQVVLSHWLADQSGDPSVLAKDLGDVINALIEHLGNKRHAMIDAANLIRVLHPRGKANEQNRRGLRMPVEEDGELALHGLGFLLREIGWAEN